MQTGYKLARKVDLEVSTVDASDAPMSPGTYHFHSVWRLITHSMSMILIITIYISICYHHNVELLYLTLRKLYTNLLTLFIYIIFNLFSNQ